MRKRGDGKHAYYICCINMLDTISTLLPNLLGLLNTYLLFFDIVSSEPGPTTTVDPVWGYMPFRRTLKAVRGEVCVPT